MPWYGFALISAICIAIVGLLEKKTLQKEHSLEYVTLFTLIKLVLFLLFFFSTTSWAVSGRQLILLSIDGTLGALAFFMVAKAMRRMEISSAVPVLSLDPGLTAVLALLFLGERLTGVHVVGLSLMVVGTYVLEIHRQSGESEKRTAMSVILQPFRDLAKQSGGKYILIGLVLFSVSSTMDRLVLRQVPTNTYVGYTLVVNALIFLVMLLRTKTRPQIFGPGQRQVFIFIVLAAAIHLASVISQAKAVSLAAVALVIAIKRLSVLIDVILGGKFFHEHHLWQKVIATAIMLIGLYCVVQV